MKRTREAQPVAREGGFTLAEVVVAIGLMSVVVVGLSGFGLISSRSLIRSKELSVATITAHETLDSLRSLPYASINAGSSSGSHTTGKFVFTVNTTVTVDTLPGIHLLKHLVVSVVNTRGRTVQRMESAVFGGI